MNADDLAAYNDAKWLDIWQFEFRWHDQPLLTVYWRRYPEPTITWQERTVRYLGTGRRAFDVSPHHSLIVECWWVR